MDRIENPFIEIQRDLRDRRDSRDGLIGDVPSVDFDQSRASARRIETTVKKKLMESTTKPLIKE